MDPSEEPAEHSLPPVQTSLDSSLHPLDQVVSLSRNLIPNEESGIHSWD
jgi:hypothetical protein